MRISRLFPALLALAAAVAACDREDPEKRAARVAARRTACVAEELALQSKERLAALDTLLATSAGSPMEQVTRASHQFATAIKAHADSAARSAVYLDSALSARTPEDSARFADVSARARPPAAAPGSVQANAAERYQQDLSTALANPNHPCNVAEKKKS